RQLLALRIRALARQGKHVEASATVVMLRDQQPRAAGNLFNVASGYAQCATAVARAKKIDELTAEERTTHDRYLDAAIGALRQAVEQGHKDAVDIRLEPTFAPLRKREDYQKLL